MASLILDFVPPEYPGFNALKVFESATQAGAPGVLIQTFVVTPGAYPTRIVVTAATSISDWFTIQWQTAEGVTSEFSQPIQGGTTTLVGILINRVLLRQPTANEIIILQATEAVVAEVFNVDDPYSVNPELVSAQYMEGMTLFIMARNLMYGIAASSSSSSGSGWTAGLVSMKATTADTAKVSREMIEWLLREAARLLGMSYSRIAQLEIQIAGGLSQIVSADISRLQIEVE